MKSKLHCLAVLQLHVAISPDYAAPREPAEIGSHSLLLLSFHEEKHGLVTKISAENEVLHPTC